MPTAINPARELGRKVSAEFLERRATDKRFKTHAALAALHTEVAEERAANAFDPTEAVGPEIEKARQQRKADLAKAGQLRLDAFVVEHRDALIAELVIEGAETSSKIARLVEEIRMASFAWDVTAKTWREIIGQTDRVVWKTPTNPTRPFLQHLPKIGGPLPALPAPRAIAEQLAENPQRTTFELKG